MKKLIADILSPIKYTFYKRDDILGPRINLKNIVIAGRAIYRVYDHEHVKFDGAKPNANSKKEKYGLDYTKIF
ncbi:MULTISPECIES: hypothetical protein [Burkholderia cepacia complex]|uniref:hypothetical protein n=1 Tax=Burkholderia cepacia complex TaxID=87882 RepID=UPI002231DEB7|nr:MULTISPECIES: hypothetical protein [Burkholderia cepacia complex]MCW3498711.1 hypothetical protein [Burkholderia cenocepacia]MCW3506201.1 hypothetical protein [Burkholderia cenocepacia]MCW3513864.1 hypothetical protein [Burkholderia cenocepacia]MCW3529014.1 hypothetical protein [Burkholderia cenocepacia]MCW3544652.1 hypothetical protein [Burkholderia cenocepacia]